MAENYVTKPYLQTQFQNYSRVVKDTFAEKGSVTINTLDYTNADEPTVTNVKTALDKLFKNCTDTIGEDFSPDVSTGSVKDFYPANTTLADIIKDMLTVKDPPQLNLSINPSKTLYDIVSESVTSLTINAIITKKTNEIAKVEFYVNDVLKHSVTSGITNGGTVPYIYNTEIKETTTIKVVVTDSEGLSATQSKTITFVGRSYYGYIEPDVEVSEAVIKTLQHNVLQNTKALTYSGITCTYHRIVYCYDKAFGELTNIVDPISGFSYNNSFEKKTITVDGIEKLCYILIEAAGSDDSTVKFS